METTKQDYIDKLLRYPEEFRKAVYRGQWSRAKYIYDTAIRVTEFLDVPAEIRTQLFGYSENEEEIKALFPKELVCMAYEKCFAKLCQGYEHESYRRYGQPPQYYIPPRYPTHRTKNG